jgi:hypothetical protein
MYQTNITVKLVHHFNTRDTHYSYCTINNQYVHEKLFILCRSIVEMVNMDRHGKANGRVFDTFLFKCTKNE